MTSRPALLASAPRVVSVGLELFAATLARLTVPVVQVDWRPPADGDVRLGMLLARLSDEREGAASEPDGPRAP